MFNRDRNTQNGLSFRQHGCSREGWARAEQHASPTPVFTYQTDENGYGEISQNSQYVWKETDVHAKLFTSIVSITLVIRHCTVF